ncbi:hypothetical protein BH10BAC2_BH10BAC2_47830 [soil metagenome]
MTILKRVLQKFNGFYYSREYICLPLEQHTFPLQVLLVRESKVVKDITAMQVMVGISPLIIALPSLEEVDQENWQHIYTVYSNSSIKEGATVSNDKIVGSLQLEKIKNQKVGDFFIYYFEGIVGKHRFIPHINQIINRFYNSFYNRSKGNIFLKGNLYTQLQVAYSVPKIIALITVGCNDLYNLLPTDQHGQINNEYYIITLRKAGNACKQALDAGKIVLSNVYAGYYKEVYAFGKNHMQPLKEIDSFDFSGDRTQILNYPLPKHVIAYRELELAESFEHGIHRIFLFRILAYKKNIADLPVLSCIHNAYATWRFKQHLPCNHFLT